MGNEFAKLPAEVQARIVIRNSCADALVDPVMDIEKADFLAQLIQENYMQFVDDEESLNKWKYEKPRICMMVDMIRDYTVKVRDVLHTLDDQLSEGNKMDRGGGLRKWASLSVRF